MAEQASNLYQQIEQQIANGQPATVLVERSDNTISTGQTLGLGPEKTFVFFADLSEGPKDGMPYRHKHNPYFTDEKQAELAEKLAGKALRASCD